MERWRQVIGHDGHVVADLRMATPQEGGRRRAVQTGYHAQWWLVSGDGDTWLGSGPVDLLDGQRSITPGRTGPVAIHPMDPSAWKGVGVGSVLHLRERVGQTLGVATVRERVGVPDAARLRTVTGRRLTDEHPEGPVRGWVTTSALPGSGEVTRQVEAQCGWVVLRHAVLRHTSGGWTQVEAEVPPRRADDRSTGRPAAPPSRRSGRDVLAPAAPGGDTAAMTVPPRSSRLPRMLRTFDVDCGDDVFPGHRLVVRGLADHGRSRDDLTSRDHSGNVECQMVALVFELVPGVTAAEEAAREPGSPFTVDATCSADVPLPWSTGGSGPTGTGGPGSHESYDEVRWGGESTVGESGPWPVPEGARRLTFWLSGPDRHHPVGTVTVDLMTGEAGWTPGG